MNNGIDDLRRAILPDVAAVEPNFTTVGVKQPVIRMYVSVRDNLQGVFIRCDPDFRWQSGKDAARVVLYTRLSKCGASLKLCQFPPQEFFASRDSQYAPISGG